ncbi:MAG: hypothetical protein GY803_17505 [Chloroflexi bacterium]|nr:hypothetical protein [Chloroflexota bacterium]
MRLEKKQEEELERRKGLTGRTIIQFTWLLISFAAAYFLVTYLFNEGYLSYNQIYNVGIPRKVPEEIIAGVFMIFVVVAMQFFLFIGYAFANPEGRRRTGDPTLQSRTKDPYNDFGH